MGKPFFLLKLNFLFVILLHIKTKQYINILKKIDLNCKYIFIRIINIKTYQ
jgi:hypothetical protein